MSAKETQLRRKMAINRACAPAINSEQENTTGNFGQLRGDGMFHLEIINLTAH